MALEYKMKQGKANRVLPRECTGHSKHPLATKQEKTQHMDITRWSVPNKIDYILCSWTLRSTRQQKQDQELAVAQIMNSLLPNSDLN